MKNNGAKKSDYGASGEAMQGIKLCLSQLEEESRCNGYELTAQLLQAAIASLSYSKARVAEHPNADFIGHKGVRSRLVEERG